MRHLAEDGTCPLCGGGFVEESAPSEASATALAEVVHLLEGFGDNLAVGAALDPTETRIARMLADLQDHLNLADTHGSGAGLDAEDDSGSPKTMPAPRRLLEMIHEVEFDGYVLQHMRQAAQCVVCCSDFEVGEPLSMLPGCRHLFHGACVREWLARRATCPICRCDLCEACGIDCAPSTPSSVILDGDGHHDALDSHRGDRVEPGFMAWAGRSMPDSSRGFSRTLSSARISPGQFGVTTGLSRPVTASLPPPPPPQPGSPSPPPVRRSSSVLVSAGSFMTSAPQRAGSSAAFASASASLHAAPQHPGLTASPSSASAAAAAAAAAAGAPVWRPEGAQFTEE